MTRAVAVIARRLDTPAVDIPSFLRSGAKAHKDQKEKLDETGVTVKVLTNKLRDLTGSLVGTAPPTESPTTSATT